jgi:hypothetical protein
VEFSVSSLQFEGENEKMKKLDSIEASGKKDHTQTN